VDKQKPCAFLHMSALRNNIEQIAKKAQHKQIRVASKSIRSVKVLQTILGHSSAYQGVMCFTADEALFLAEKGLDDLLIAYPVWDTSQLRAISQRTQKNKRIIVMIDSMEHVKHLEMVALETGHKFLVCLDIDLSTTIPGLYFGTYRSPVRNIGEAVKIAKRIEKSRLLELDGIMGYEAQIAGVTDQDPKQRLKSMVIRRLKSHSKKEVSKRRADIVHAVEQEIGRKLRFVNGGGTGSLDSTGKEAVVTEMTAGSGFYNPHLFDKYANFQLEPAAGFAIEITRIPTKEIFTCAGGGYIASGAAGEDRLPEVYLPHDAQLTTQEGAGEVQTPIEYKGKLDLKHGDPIFMRHSKAGELCERFQSIHLIENGEVIESVPTYRGEGKCFL